VQFFPQAYPCRSPLIAAVEPRKMPFGVKNFACES
jgi:hypothetical protein